MSADVSVEGASDPTHVIKWLDEQRRSDHAQIVEIARAVDELRDQVREQGALLARVSTARIQQPSDTSGTDEALNQLKEHIQLIEGAIEDHFAQGERAEQFQRSLHDRDVKQLAELMQRIDELSRQSDSVNGRVQAVAEEVRHEREARLPLGQLLDNVQRSQQTLQGRLALLDELSRRYTTFQSIMEQSDEKRRDEVVRLDQQVKLVDLRLTRDLSTLQQGVDEWRGRSDDQAKPIADLFRRVGSLEAQLDKSSERQAELLKEVDSFHFETGRIDSQVKSDRSLVDRLAESIEAQNRRIEAAGASAWQAGERAASLSSGIDDVRMRIDDLIRRVDDIDRRITRFDEERRKLDSAVLALETELRAEERDARDRTAELSTQIDNAVDALKRQIDLHYRVAMDQRRRSLADLEQQVRELEAGQS